MTTPRTVGVSNWYRSSTATDSGHHPSAIAWLQETIRFQLYEIAAKSDSSEIEFDHFLQVSPARRALVEWTGLRSHGTLPSTHTAVLFYHPHGSLIR